MERMPAPAPWRRVQSTECRLRLLIRAAAHHADDLDSVPLLEGDGLVGGSLEDRAVVLHGDSSWVDAELCDVGQQRGWSLKLDALSIDLQGDHDNLTCPWKA